MNLLQVVTVAFATALLAYPNEYTRMGAPKLIYLLFRYKSNGLVYQAKDRT